MKKIREYLDKKKIDKKFKSLGGGYFLTEQPQTTSAKNLDSIQQATEARARAAEAVERRLNTNKPEMNYSQKAVYMKAKRELEEEKRQAEQHQNKSIKAGSLSPTHKLKNESVDNCLVRFTCDLLDEVVLPKNQMYEAIETFLRGQLIEESIDASILMIYTLNTSSTVNSAVQIIQKYLKNIIENPKETKFCQIKMSNKVFTEKVLPVKGAIEFLKAIGFIESDLLNETTNDIESFLVMIEPNVSVLSDSLTELLNGSSVSIKLFRNPKAYLIDPSKPIPKPIIPSDFYNLTSTEIKNMQDSRTKEVERLTTLRTSKMRNSDAVASPTTTYKYTIIRIRFPNNYVLEATFNVYESVFAVREFVSNQLDFEQGIFILSVSIGTRCVLKDEKSLLESGLVPAALIFFDWSDETMNYFISKKCEPLYLNREWERIAGTLE